MMLKKFELHSKFNCCIIKEKTSDQNEIGMKSEPFAEAFGTVPLLIKIFSSLVCPKLRQTGQLTFPPFK